MGWVQRTSQTQELGEQTEEETADPEILHLWEVRIGRGQVQVEYYHVVDPPSMARKQLTLFAAFVQWGRAPAIDLGWPNLTLGSHWPWRRRSR